MKFSTTTITIFLIVLSVSLSNACTGGGLECKNEAGEMEMCTGNQACLVKYMKSGKIEKTSLKILFKLQPSLTRIQMRNE